MELNCLSDSSVYLIGKLDPESVNQERLPCGVYFTEPLPVIFNPSRLYF